MRPAALGIVWLLAWPVVASAAPLSPFLKGPYLQSLSSHSVEVRAEVDPKAKASLKVEGGGKVLVATDDAAIGFHALSVDGLSPKTTYKYTLESGGAQATGTFTTAPPDSDEAPITMLVYGDTRTDTTKHAAFVRALQDEPSDFLVHTGDFVDDAANASHWQVFFDVEGPLLRDRCLFAAVGNHELTDAQAGSFLRYFATKRAASELRLDESVRFGMVRLFFINGWGSLAYGADRDWLEKALTSADAEPGVRWRFLVVHHGPYSSGLHGSNDRFQTAELGPLLIKHKVDLILSGHDHIYERGNDGLLRYLVTGGAGAPLYPLGPPLPQTRVALSEYHYVKLTASKEKVTIEAKGLDQAPLDRASFAFGTDRAWDGDPSPAASAPSRSASSDAPATKKQDDCACSVPGAPEGFAGAVGPLAFASALTALFVRRRRARAC